MQTLWPQMATFDPPPLWISDTYTGLIPVILMATIFSRAAPATNFVPQPVIYSRYIL